MAVSTRSTRAVPMVTAAEVPVVGLAGPPQDRPLFVPVARCVPGGRASAARPVPVRPRPWRASSRVSPAGGLATAARFVLVAALAAVAVVALGLLSDAVRQARVPESTALVRVHPGESLWQVARRAAPSADPGAVAARIVELNSLPSPSVRDGDVLVSPVG